MRTRAKWGSALSPRLSTKILIGLLTGTLLASADLLAFPSQSFSLGDLNLAAADTIRGSGGGRLASYPALSGDGSTVIFGQPGHWGWAGTPRATVEVREWNGSSWVAKGALPDAANREIGYWHDISDNGDVVSYSTHVLDKVFVADWSGSAWVQRPTITASQAGVSLVRHSLSGDGNVLVVGERLFDNGGEGNNGKVRTLDWDGSSWSERTAIIGAEGELLGNSRMDITADGATISFGGSLYSNADGAEVGRVRVASWDGASWTERPALTGSQASARAANAVLSNDGQVLAFSEAEFRVSGRVRTFDWSGSSWSERPVAAEGSTAWIDVDLNASGTTISLSDNDTQKVRIYDWVGDAWVQRGSDVPTFAPGGGGHYGNVASLSSSGLSVATSQIYSDVNGSRSGQVDIYRSPGALRGVVFDSNGGSGAMSTQTNYNSAALSSSSFSKTAATFSSWNTAADGSGTNYADGATYDFLANVMFYAQWAPIAITFDANSGSGSMADQSAAGSTALTSNSFTRQAYSFAGWNTAADGSGTAYANGASYAFAASATLYAQWSAIPQPRSAESESANAPLIFQNAAPVPALRRATPLAEPDQPVKKAPVVIERDSESPASEAAAEAVALVGGEAVIVQSKNIGSQSVVFDTGAVTVGVTVAPKDGVVNSAGGKTSLTIAKNAAAQLQGAGLKPDTMVQVFLPASSGSFIELPSVRVGDSGSFEASLTMGSSARAKPMPIGKNSIQMIGIDQNGKDTVLDIPITIAQSLPAPETNRVNGQRPVLKPGETLALNAGTPDTVTLTRSDAATSLEGNDWSFTVEGAISDESMETLAFTRDAPVAFSGTGFMPGTRADVWLFSDPILVGTVDIAADGTFSTNFAVDSNFVPTGNHTLQMQGVGTDGYVKSANLGVVVQDEMNTPVLPVEVDPLNVVPLLLIGTSLGGLLVLVGVTIAIGRRQRARGQVVPAL